MNVHLVSPSYIVYRAFYHQLDQIRWNNILLAPFKAWPIIFQKIWTRVSGESRGLELACPDWLNLSIATNIFPDKWKIGQVKQLHKSGQQRERNNCRPIPVRQILSKILEKHVANL